jgi:hypothetical protein
MKDLEPEYEHREETSTGLIDGTEPAGWWFRVGRGPWHGPWVDRETAVYVATGEGEER